MREFLVALNASFTSIIEKGLVVSSSITVRCPPPPPYPSPPFPLEKIPILGKSLGFFALFTFILKN